MRRFDLIRSSTGAVCKRKDAANYVGTPHEASQLPYSLRWSGRLNAMLRQRRKCGLHKAIGGSKKSLSVQDTAAYSDHQPQKRPSIGHERSSLNQQIFFDWTYYARKQQYMGYLSANPSWKQHDSCTVQPGDVSL